MTLRGKSSGPRQLKVRVRGGRNRSQSSKLWLERQLNDPYVARAKREGMRSRAAYKLMEIDDRAHFLRKGARVVDLGAAPGGWSQVAARRVGAPEQGRVVAIDILPMDPVPGVDFAGLDFLDESAPARLKDMIGGPADVVLSDMAANATGHAKTDHLKIMDWWKRPRILPEVCWLPAVAFLQRCCRAARRLNCSRPSSAITRPSNM